MCWIVTLVTFLTFDPSQMQSNLADLGEPAGDLHVGFAYSLGEQAAEPSLVQTQLECK